MNEYAKPPLPTQQQPMPGRTGAMRPKPDHGEHSYRGSGKLTGMKAVITGADSGIGRAVAIAFAREGADILMAYLDEHDDANETKRWVAVKNFGKNVPLKRPGQPAELATTYVMLADPLSSYVSGATVAVTGGRPIL
jgi:NAD(P)-dependent dehydrogenase (short-subunit alcohol dehydrogenase family)